MRRFLVLLCAVAGALGCAQRQPADDPAARQAAAITQAVDRQDDRALAWAAAAADPGPSSQLDQAVVRALMALPDDGSSERRVASDRLLDACIRRRVGVQVAGLDRLAADRQWRAAAILLMAAHPRESAEAALRQFSRPCADAEWLALADLLTAARTPGCAAALLAGLTIHLEVWVVDDGHQGGGRSRAIARFGDGRLEVPAGFPADVVYQLLTTPADGAVLAAAGPPRAVFVQRTEYPPGAHGIGGASTPLERDPLRIAALDALLGGHDPEPALRAEDQERITWSSARGYAAQLAQVQAEQAAAWAATVAALLRHGCLTSGEAARLTPDIRLQIHDLRADRTQALPPGTAAAAAASR